MLSTFKKLSTKTRLSLEIAFYIFIFGGLFGFTLDIDTLAIGTLMSVISVYRYRNNELIENLKSISKKEELFRYYRKLNIAEHSMVWPVNNVIVGKAWDVERIVVHNLEDELCPIACNFQIYHN